MDMDSDDDLPPDLEGLLSQVKTVIDLQNSGIPMETALKMANECGLSEYQLGEMVVLQVAKNSDNARGRPPELTGGGRMNIYLDDESKQIAKRAGCGDGMSAGIRVALQFWRAANPE